MRTLSILLLLITAGLAFADDVHVAVATHEVNASVGFFTGNSGRIYYDCQNLEQDVTDFLAELGATNINIRCTGGLDQYNRRFSSIARISGSFESKVESPNGTELATFTDLQLRGRDNCALVAELFKIFGKNFAIRNLSGRGSRVSSICTSSRSYNVNLQVAR